MDTVVAIAEEQIINQIHMIRGQKVMLDRDLARMYGVDTSQLKRQVRRNIERFPEDFMFEMTKVELEDWRCHFGISNPDRMGLRHPPYCFTEQGVAMLSSVLGSKTAIAVNIQIIRVFTRMRNLLLQHQDLLAKLEHLENRMEEQDQAIHENKEEIRTIFKVLKQLLQHPNQERKPVGFKTKSST